MRAVSNKFGFRAITSFIIVCAKACSPSWLSVGSTMTLLSTFPCVGACGYLIRRLRRKDGHILWIPVALVLGWMHCWCARFASATSICLCDPFRIRTITSYMLYKHWTLAIGSSIIQNYL